MPDICRITDMSAGHDGYASVPAIEGDGYMVVNGQPVHCVGHAWQIHCRDSCHQGRLAAGSAYYIVNGQPVGRVGDPIDCNDAVATGDPYFVIRD